jgi:hypothetical protein
MATTLSRSEQQFASGFYAFSHRSYYHQHNHHHHHHHGLRRWNVPSSDLTQHQSTYHKLATTSTTCQFSNYNRDASSESSSSDNDSTTNSSSDGGVDGGEQQQQQQQQSSPRMDPRKVIFARNPEPEDEPILTATLDWVQQVVIGLNLCPFAEQPYQSNRLFLEVIHGRDETEILSRLLGECLVRQDQPGTTLMICPDLYPTNFESYLQVYNMMNDGVLQDDYQGDTDDDDHLSHHVQIAPFHPFFEFDGSGKDGVDNYTNRSPYPMFHILREEEVGRAVDLLDGDASKVWKRNVELLEALGDEFDDDTLRVILSGKITDSTIRDKVREIYKALKRKTTGKKG